MPYTFNVSDIAGQPRNVYVETDMYVHGGLAVQLMDVLDGELYATVSIYVQGVCLGEDDFVFKTYSENEGLLEAMLKAGVVEETGVYVELEFGEPQPICHLLRR